MGEKSETEQKFSIGQQVEEIEREIALRASVYPRLISSGKMKQSVADYHGARMRAVLKTLKWFAENEDKIRAALSRPNDCTFDASCPCRACTEIHAQKTATGEPILQ